MADVYVCEGLYLWLLGFEDGSQRAVLASSLQSAIGSGLFPSTVVLAERGPAFDGVTTPPVLTSLVPDTAQLGDPNFTLHVHGTGFRQGDTILWNNSPEKTTYVSATELTTTVNMATAAVPMAIPVAVQNAVGVLSNTLTFDLEPEA
jgi:hypothetical protein